MFYINNIKFSNMSTNQGVKSSNYALPDEITIYNFTFKRLFYTYIQSHLLGNQSNSQLPPSPKLHCHHHANAEVGICPLL
jgi:hypothetical protein